MITTRPVNKVDNKAAKSLFAIWKDDKNVVDDKVLARPVNISMDEIDAMAKDGLVKYYDDKLEVTDKGAEVIKTMILGDDKSAFEDMGDILDYHKAQTNIKPKMSKSRRKNKVGSCVAHNNSGNWYKRFKEAND